MAKKIVAILTPILGFLFLTAYIRSATVDVVYTDYMRLVNSYLKNVWDLTPYLQPDVLTRIPVTYPARILNVTLFGYSTTFDMVLGALGMTAAATVVAVFMAKKKLSVGISLSVLLLLFSLNKWEMLTNGSGWMHFWAIALFYDHYLVYDRVRSGEGKKGDECRLCVLPFVTILLFAGPYTAIYAGALSVVYALDLLTEGRGKKSAASAETAAAFRSIWIRRFVCLLVPTALFILSRACSVEEYAGAVSESFLTLWQRDLLMPLRMAVYSAASMILGGETITELGLPAFAIWLMGLLVGLGYLYALFVNFRSGLYRKTAFPLLLLLSGVVSHGVILLSRWIFPDPLYVMSSRYALQYQSGIAGILLTLWMAGREDFQSPVGKVSCPFCKGPLVRRAAVLFTVILLAGQLVTTGREIRMAPYRKEAFTHMKEVAVNYENETDETLKSVLQYHSPEDTRKALGILQEKRLNIFR